MGGRGGGGEGWGANEYCEREGKFLKKKKTRAWKPTEVGET